MIGNVIIGALPVITTACLAIAAIRANRRWRLAHTSAQIRGYALDWLWRKLYPADDAGWGYPNQPVAHAYHLLLEARSQRDGWMRRALEAEARATSAMAIARNEAVACEEAERQRDAARVNVILPVVLPGGIRWVSPEER